MGKRKLDEKRFNRMRAKFNQQVNEMALLSAENVKLHAGARMNKLINETLRAKLDDLNQLRT